MLFEFTDYFLIEIYHNVCYCYHHTFAFNSVLERLNAINNCPKNILILSSFDFSLYLYPNVCCLLKNYASVFTPQKPPPPPPPPRRPQVKKPSQMSHIHELLKLTLNSPRTPNRPPSIRLETPKPTNTVPDTPPTTNEIVSLNPEQFEYDTIETPQKFPSDLYVDWRIVNLVLWSKCYCRYDQNYMPDLSEQQLLSEISSLQERIGNARTKSQKQMTIDALHSVRFSNEIICIFLKFF